MGLDRSDKIDAAGIEISTGKVILTIADSWDWEDAEAHRRALAAKLNAYLGTVESGELLEVYPGAVGREVAIDLITRLPLHADGRKLLEQAAEIDRELKLNIEFPARHVPGEE